MTDHTHTSLVDDCYRCDLNRDEIAGMRAEIEAEAETAWLSYRNAYSLRNNLSPRRAASQMRRREFIAGYLAANGIEVLA